MAFTVESITITTNYFLNSSISQPNLDPHLSKIKNIIAPLLAEFSHILEKNPPNNSSSLKSSRPNPNYQKDEYECIEEEKTESKNYPNNQLILSNENNTNFSTSADEIKIYTAILDPQADTITPDAENEASDILTPSTTQKTKELFAKYANKSQEEVLKQNVATFLKTRKNELRHLSPENEKKINQLRNKILTEIFEECFEAYSHVWKNPNNHFSYEEIKKELCLQIESLNICFAQGFSIKEALKQKIQKNKNKENHSLVSKLSKREQLRLRFVQKTVQQSMQQIEQLMNRFVQKAKNNGIKDIAALIAVQINLWKSIEEEKKSRKTILPKDISKHEDEIIKSYSTTAKASTSLKNPKLSNFEKALIDLNISPNKYQLHPAHRVAKWKDPAICKQIHIKDSRYSSLDWEAFNKTCSDHNVQCVIPLLSLPGFHSKYAFQYEYAPQQKSNVTKLGLVAKMDDGKSTRSGFIFIAFDKKKNVVFHCKFDQISDHKVILPKKIEEKFESIKTFSNVDETDTWPYQGKYAYEIKPNGILLIKNQSQNIYIYPIH